MDLNTVGKAGQCSSSTCQWYFQDMGKVGSEQNRVEERDDWAQEGMKEAATTAANSPPEPGDLIWVMLASAYHWV